MKTLIIIALVLQSIGLFIKLIFSLYDDGDIKMYSLRGYCKISMLPTLFFEGVYIYLLCVLQVIVLTTKCYLSVT